MCSGYTPPMPDTWKPCSSCKKPIRHGAKYTVCSVSTCNRARTGYVFCSISCWDAHVPVMNHRGAWAEERRAPAASNEPTANREAPRRRLVRPAGSKARQSPDLNPVDDEAILVVVSRVKDYIRQRSGDMSTSADVLEALSVQIRAQCDDAIRRARMDGRKTVKGRDFSSS